MVGEIISNANKQKLNKADAMPGAPSTTTDGALFFVFVFVLVIVFPNLYPDGFPPPSGELEGGFWGFIEAHVRID